MRYFKLLIDKKFKFLAFIQVINPKLDIFPSLLLREKVARNATDEELELVNINKREPPTRVLPLPLLRKEIHPLLRFTND